MLSIWFCSRSKDSGFARDRRMRPGNIIRPSKKTCTPKLNRSRPTSHISHLTSHISPLIPHVSYLTSHTHKNKCLPTLAAGILRMLKKLSSAQAGTVIAGLVFAILWGSASTATRIGLESARPFVIAICRFAMAATLMLVLAHVFFRKRLPQRHEWRLLFVYGLLNVGIYL